MTGMFRLPVITGTTNEQQLAQIKGYLHQLVEQLNAAQTPAAAAPAPAAKTPAPRATFESIKGLIIKSADIVEAYSQQIASRLEGQYVAKSDYGEFMERTAQSIQETSQSVTRTFDHFQQVTTQQGEQLRTVTANVRTGLLFTAGSEDTALGKDLPEGTPVYGLELGQQADGAFVRFARFTPYGLAFYDENNLEAAYITDRTLHIGEAQIALSLRMGDFVESVTFDGGTVTRWVGA